MVVLRTIAISNHSALGIHSSPIHLLDGVNFTGMTRDMFPRLRVIDDHRRKQIAAAPRCDPPVSDDCFRSQTPGHVVQNINAQRGDLLGMAEAGAFLFRERKR